MSDEMNAFELSEDELGGVQGGYEYTCENGSYYKYVGMNLDLKYLCPKCGRPLHVGTAGLFYCDPCDEKWFFEKSLDPNLQSGAWKSITKEEYVDGATWKP